MFISELNPEKSYVVKKKQRKRKRKTLEFNSETPKAILLYNTELSIIDHSIPFIFLVHSKNLVQTLTILKSYLIPSIILVAT